MASDQFEWNYAVSIPSGGDWVWDEFKARVKDERLNQSLHKILREREYERTPTMGELLYEYFTCFITM